MLKQRIEQHVNLKNENKDIHQHQLPERLVKYLSLLKELNHPGFSKLISTDAETLLRQEVIFWQKMENSGYDYCFRVRVSSQACLLLKIPQAVPDVNKYAKADIHIKNGMSATKLTEKMIVLPLSGILALIDDLTTYAIVIQDKKSRPGVSISLSGSLTPYGLMNLPVPGDLIDVNVKIVKIGSRLGFLEACVICTKTKHVIATGRHIKFLELGSEYMYVSEPATAVKNSMNDEVIQQNSDLNKNMGGTTLGMQDLLKFQFNNSEDTAHIYLRQEHMNPMDSFHGGAIAMAMEQFASNTRTNCTHFQKSKEMHLNKTTLSNDLRLRSISINYVSRGKSQVSFKAIRSQFYSMFATIGVKVISSGDGSVIADGVLDYVNTLSYSKENKQHIESRL